LNPNAQAWCQGGKFLRFVEVPGELNPRSPEGEVRFVKNLLYFLHQAFDDDPFAVPVLAKLVGVVLVLLVKAGGGEGGNLRYLPSFAAPLRVGERLPRR
jgi:hypothetical protein